VSLFERAVEEIVGTIKGIVKLLLLMFAIILAIGTAALVIAAIDPLKGVPHTSSVISFRSWT
jgi:hypothetical protein